jgi:hypothetical protein
MSSKTYMKEFSARISILIVLILLSFPVIGQIENHMILRKNGFKNKIHFLTGDPITFIREGNNYTEEYYIQGIGTDCIIVGGDEVPIKNIALVVRYRQGFNFNASGKTIMVAAPGYLLIGVINALFQGISPVPTKTNLIVAGSMVAVGAILPTFQIKKYHLGKRYSLAIVQSDPAFYKQKEQSE